jgi:hypothetical protein
MQLKESIGRSEINKKKCNREKYNIAIRKINRERKSTKQIVSIRSPKRQNASINSPDKQIVNIILTYQTKLNQTESNKTKLNKKKNKPNQIERSYQFKLPTETKDKCYQIEHQYITV